MTTYQIYHDHKMEIKTFEFYKFLHILFATLFLTAVFIVPVIGAIVFLFF